MTLRYIRARERRRTISLEVPRLSLGPSEFAYENRSTSFAPTREVRVERDDQGEPVPYEEVRSVHDVIDLVADLESMHRYHAVVVVTPRPDGTYPFNAEEISASVADVSVKVYRFEAASLTFALTDRLTRSLSAFDGAARLYPRGVAWKAEKGLAPLYFEKDDAESQARHQRSLIRKARVFSHKANQVTPTKVGAGSRKRLSVDPGATPLSLTRTVEARPELSDSGRPAALQLDARDKTIRERDATISMLQMKLIEESDRVARISEMFIAAQEGDRQAEARKAKAVARERELLRENAELKRKLSEEREARRVQVKGAKARVTVATSEASSYQPDLFPDLDDAVKFAIQHAWVQRVPPTEKKAHPLPSFKVGPRFAESLDNFDPQFQSKALRVVVSVLTGLAIEKRQVHYLREGSAAPKLVRDADKAICYRAYIEENVAAARRLHYWKLPDGTIELSRVVVHDDYEP